MKKTNIFINIELKEENDYEGFTKECNVNINETWSWIDLIKKSIKVYDLEAMVVNGHNYTSLIGKKDDLDIIEEILYYVENEEISVEYIFEGEVYRLLSTDDIVVEKETIVFKNGQTIIGEWDREKLEKDIEFCFTEINYISSVPKEWFLESCIKKSCLKTPIEIATKLFLLNEMVETILAYGYTLDSKFVGDENDEIFKHTQESFNIWELVCNLYVDDDTKLVEQIIKNKNPNFPIGWLIEEHNVETGEMRYVKLPSF